MDLQRAVLATLFAGLAALSSAIEGTQAEVQVIGQRPLALPGKESLAFGSDDEVGWVDVRAEPGGRRIAQLLLGQRVSVVDKQLEWCQIEAHGESGFDGWVLCRGLAGMTELTRSRWKAWPSFIISVVPGVELRPGKGIDGLLPFGAVLPGDPQASGLGVPLTLPDASEVLVPRDALRPVERPLGPETALRLMSGFARLPYLDGGNTRGSFDDAGLVWLFFRVLRVPVPRDKVSLEEAGDSVLGSPPQLGDVVVLSASDAGTHVVLTQRGPATYFEASPASGVNFLSRDQVKNREVRDVRRLLPFASVEHGGAPSEAAGSSQLPPIEALGGPWMVVGAIGAMVLNAVGLLAYLIRLRRSDAPEPKRIPQGKGANGGQGENPSRSGKPNIGKLRFKMRRPGA